jgi:hypothetical protein
MYTVLVSYTTNKRFISKKRETLKIYCLIQYREQSFERSALRPQVGLWRGPLGLSLYLPLSSLWLLRALSPNSVRCVAPLLVGIVLLIDTAPIKFLNLV